MATSKPKLSAVIRRVNEMKDADAQKTHQLGEDGVDHIHLSPFGKTKIGKMLSRSWRRKFFIPQLGQFFSAVCAAKWLLGAGDDARFDDRVQLNGYHEDFNKLVTWAKYYQLTAMRNDIATEGKSDAELNLKEYKIHTSGVRELPRDQHYASSIQAMVTWLNIHSPKDKVQWDMFGLDGIEVAVAGHIKDLTNSQV